MLIFILFIFLFGNISCSDDDVNGGHSVVRIRTPLHATVVRVDSTSDDDLCDDIVRSTFIGQSIHARYIRPCLIQVIRESRSSPTAREDIADTNGMVMKAISKVLDNKQSKIEERWSRTQTAIASTVSSAVVALIVGLVQHFTTK